MTRHKRAFEKIAEQVRNYVYEQKLMPGDKLPSERELAVQFGLGRMVVREALRVLEQSGLVYVKHGGDGGSYVKGVDRSVVSGSISDVIRRGSVGLAHLTEVRIGVEKLVIGVAMARMSDSELELLKKHLEDAEAILDISTRQGTPPDFSGWAECNVQFHMVIAQATGNPLYVMILGSLMDVVRSFFTDLAIMPEFLEAHMRDHRAIYEAVKSKDLRLAERRLEEHSLELERGLSFTK